MPGPVSMTLITTHVVVAAEPDADAAAIGELDRVADEIEQDLAQPVAVAEEMARQVGGDKRRDLETLGLGARRHQLRHRLDQQAGSKRSWASSSLPASTLAKSRMSSTSASSASPEVRSART